MSEETPDENTNNDENTEAAPDTAGQQPQPEASTQDDAPDTGETDWQAEADKWKSLARKHEKRHMDALGLEPGELDTLRQRAGQLDEQSGQLEQLREQVTSRDSQLATAQHTLAAEKLHTRLARAGVPNEDAVAVIEHIDPSRLIEDGAPSETAIESVAASLSRSVARGVDEDQGQTSPSPATSADQWLRQKARK